MKGICAALLMMFSTGCTSAVFDAVDAGLNKVGDDITRTDELIRKVSTFRYQSSKDYICRAARLEDLIQDLRTPEEWAAHQVFCGTLSRQASPPTPPTP